MVVVGVASLHEELRLEPVALMAMRVVVVLVVVVVVTLLHPILMPMLTEMLIAGTIKFT